MSCCITNTVSIDSDPLSPRGLTPRAGKRAFVTTRFALLQPQLWTLKKWSRPTSPQGLILCYNSRHQLRLKKMTEKMTEKTIFREHIAQSGGVCPRHFGALYPFTKWTIHNWAKIFGPDVPYLHTPYIRRFKGIEIDPWPSGGARLFPDSFRDIDLPTYWK